MAKKPDLGAPFEEPNCDSAGEYLLRRFVFENLNLIDECGGLFVQPWSDDYRRIRISITYPPGTTEPGLKQRWKTLIAQWLTQAARFNERNRQKEKDYPPPLQRWLALRERLEQFLQLDPAIRTEWIKEEIKESLYVDGLSYQDLADSMNQWIGETMTEFLTLEAFNTAQRDRYPKLKYEAICDMFKPKYESLRDAMTFFNVPLDKQNRFFKEARRRYELRECIVQVLDGNDRRVRKPRLDGPITRRQVEAKVRQMRKARLTSPS